MTGVQTCALPIFFNITFVGTSLFEAWCDDGVALTERQTALLERRIAHIDNERKDLWKELLQDMCRQWV